MKKLLLLITALTSFTLSAQDNENERRVNTHTIKLAIGPANIASAPGIRLDTEYGLSLGRYFEFLTAVTMINGYDGLRDEERVYQDIQLSNGYVKSVQYSMMSLGGSICLTPLKDFGHRFLVGAGFNLCNQVETGSVVNALSSPITFSQKNDRSFGIGYNALIGYEHTFGTRIMAGLRGSALIYKDFNPALLFSVGYRFD